MTRPPTNNDAPERFDGSYYRRFYGPNGAHDAEQIARLATAVHNLAAWWGIRIRTVLDVGAGKGLWRDWYNLNHPRVRVTSIDVSEHACRRWGHMLRDISEWTPPKPADLVVCHSVLQYLDNRAASSALLNLSIATRHLMYLEVPTKRDLATIVDPEATDMDVHARSGSWYRTRLAEHFIHAGAGLWVKRDSIPMYELEAAGY